MANKLTNSQQKRSIFPSLSSHMNPQSSSTLSSLSVTSLPIWCEDISRIPSMYCEVWRNVQLNHNSLVCDTNKVYAILMSSGLTQTVLAQIWSAVNLTIAGQLTRHELFLALAIIGLIQQNSANPLTDVLSVDVPPIPRLHSIPGYNNINSSVQYQHSQQTQRKQNTSLECVQPISAMKSEIKNNILTPITNDIQINGNTKFTPNYCIDINEINGDNDDDEFADFKSAEMSQTTVHTTIPNNSVAFDFPQKLSLCSSYFNDDIKTANSSNTSGFINNVSKSVNFSNASEQSVLNSHRFEIKNTKSISLADALSLNLSAISINDHLNSNSNRLESNINSTNINKDTNNSGDALCSPTVSILESLSETVSESEFVPSIDKYSVFRDITIDDHLAKGDDFGEFLSHATNFDAESVDSLHLANQDNDNDTIDNIKQQVMNCCRQLIYKSFNVLIVNHGEESVIEAISSSDGNNFALNLLEVYRIAKRIWKSTSKSSESFAKLMEDIESAWNGINSVFTKASVQIPNTDEEANEKLTSCCAICWNNFSNGHSLLSFGGYEYHFSCANLWLNCIHSSLPKPPSLHCR